MNKHIKNILPGILLSLILISSAHAGIFDWITGSATASSCTVGGYNCEKDASGQLTNWAQKCYNSTWINTQLCDNGCEISTGQCNSAVVKEKVKCTFANSPDASQDCATVDGKFRCSGINTCVVDVYGEKGAYLNWEATCPGKTRTILDGNNDYAYFNCTWPEQTTQTVGLTYYIKTRKCPDGAEGTPYKCDVDATIEKNIAYSISAVSPSVDNFAVIDINTGVVTWNSPKAGKYKFTAEAANLLTNEVASQTYVINIAGTPSANAPIISTKLCPDGVVGTPYKCDIDATGTGDLTYQISAVSPLVDNFAVTNLYTGVVSWNTPQAGTYKFTMEVDDLTTGLTSTKTYVINIAGTQPEPTTQAVAACQIKIGDVALLLSKSSPVIREINGVSHTVEVLDIIENSCQIKIDDVAAIIDIGDTKTVNNVKVAVFGVSGAEVTETKIQCMSDSDLDNLIAQCKSKGALVSITTDKNSCKMVTCTAPQEETAQIKCMTDANLNSLVAQCKSKGALISITTDKNGCPAVTCTAVQEQATQTQCSGCFVDNTCLPIGVRKGSEYCDVDQIMKEQKNESTVCGNSFECNGNLCVNHACVSGSLWQKILDFFSGLFK
ncbi:hypothetical protein JXB27_00065 [Candidatus Woesearchaeota archaeon]|nr:hypothetical protein [Candidatus Woesearchaeota archaeon]